MTFADHFSSVARGYAAYRPLYPTELASALAEHAPRGVAWDVGCGSGQLSVALAEHFDRVIATDPAAAQIANATPHPRVEYRVASAEVSGLAAQSVELVVAAQAAHWFDWPAFLVEVERVARPGALLALISYGIHSVDLPAANALIERYYHHDLGGYWPKGREHVENGYRDLAWPYEEIAPPDLAMTATWSRDEMVGYLGTWSATAKLIAAKGNGTFETLRAQLAEVWPDDETHAVRWPLAIKLARR